ncbi:MAG: Rieske (2Fe-2S) protein [Nitrospiria bacterium]
MSAEKSLLPLFPEDQVKPSRSAKFSFLLDGQKLEGFVVNENGKFLAYVNKCRHMGVTLDWDSNEFYTKEKDLLICKTHGATYTPGTGECAGGPCSGKSLFSLPLVRKSGQLFLDMDQVRLLYGK